MTAPIHVAVPTEAAGRDLAGALDGDFVAHCHVSRGRWRVTVSGHGSPDRVLSDLLTRIERWLEGTAVERVTVEIDGRRYSMSV